MENQAGMQETQENRKRPVGDLPDQELTDKILAAAIRVHRELGPGYLESIYEEAMCVELVTMGLAFERQKSVEVQYRNQVVGHHRLDLLVGSKVVVELKAIKELEPVHFSVVRSYLKATGLATGLLLNFHSVPLAINRVGREYRNSVP